MYKKHCKQCNTLFIDTSNNQKRYCDECVYKRTKERWTINNNKTMLQRGDYAPNKIQCLICHKYYRKPMSHAWQVHGTTAREYKDNYQLEQKGLIPDDDRKILREHVYKHKDIVITQNLIKKGRKTRFKGGKDWDYNYKRKPETLKRLSTLNKYKKQ